MKAKSTSVQELLGVGLVAVLGHEVLGLLEERPWSAPAASLLRPGEVEVGRRRQQPVRPRGAPKAARTMRSDSTRTAADAAGSLVRVFFSVSFWSTPRARGRLHGSP